MQFWKYIEDLQQSLDRCDRNIFKESWLTWAKTVTLMTITIPVMVATLSMMNNLIDDGKVIQMNLPDIGQHETSPNINCVCVCEKNLYRVRHKKVFLFEVNFLKFYWPSKIQSICIGKRKDKLKFWGLIYQIWFIGSKVMLNWIKKLLSESDKTKNDKTKISKFTLKANARLYVKWSNSLFWFIVFHINLQFQFC